MPLNCVFKYSCGEFYVMCFCHIKKNNSKIPFLEEEMATHFSILAWEIPWTQEPGRLQSIGSQELDTT